MGSAGGQQEGRDSLGLSLPCVSFCNFHHGFYQVTMRTMRTPFSVGRAGKSVR